MMLLRKRFSGVILSVLLASTCFGAQAASQCANKEEKMALETRIVQSELMVGALTCNKQKSYNQLVQKFKANFAESGQHLRHYFERIHGSRANRNIDLFVTRLANEASQRSLKQHNYCDGMSKLFEQTLSMSPSQFINFSSEQRFAESDIPACGSYKLAGREKP